MTTITADPPAGNVTTTSPLDAASLQPAQRFEIRKTIGRGATAVVYAVWDRVLEETVALKVLDPSIAPSEQSLAMFRNELKVTRRLAHPNIATLYDLCMWDGRLAFTQALVDGVNLSGALMRGALPVKTVMRYLRYLSSALDAAHQLGVVHGDLKPGNIVIDGYDRPHIVDFGTAALTGSAQLGSDFTPWYVAPERIERNGPIHPAGDIYSLGVLLYQMATGELPFADGDPAEVLEAHRSKQPLPPRELRPDLPGVLAAGILSCLAKTPSQRPASAGRLYAGLARDLKVAVDDTIAVQRMARTVLVVEPETDSRHQLAAIVRSNLLGVIEAEDGYSAMELAFARKPHLIVMNRELPRLDGLEALRILRSNPLTAATPVVVVSDAVDPERAVFDREMGVVFTMSKPIRDDVLQLLLERHLLP